MFGPLELYKSKNTVSVLNNPLWPKVSICIIVKNELENLRVLLPLLVSQSYDGEYDIHIVDDHSSDGTLHWLTAYKAEHEILVHAHASEVTSLNGKKHALSYALTLTMHDILLMTDADCRPNSSHWISSMVDELGKNEDLVLGYSPYLTLPGTLNQLIQLETTFTAWLYLGMTLNRSAFMGVGRNILYRTSILKKSNNLLKYKNVLSGDDEIGRAHV